MKGPIRNTVTGCSGAPPPATGALALQAAHGLIARGRLLTAAPIARFV